MEQKEKLDYLWKIIFLIVFGLIIGFAGIYTIIKFPFTIGTVIYMLFGIAGAVFCGWGAASFIKEYITIKKNDKKFNNR
jgi:uncharacterized membrane protein YeaQ/YmgE (transglycosylase-associated protein family)